MGVDVHFIFNTATHYDTSLQSAKIKIRLINLGRTERGFVAKETRKIGSESVLAILRVSLVLPRYGPAVLY